MADSAPQISVIIPTRNRADSLAITLDCLASANRDGIRVEVIVVNNGEPDPGIAVGFGARIPIRYLWTSSAGKGLALNCALDAGALGDIIAILDDDMSPLPDWFQGVIAICQRWPDRDIFTGQTPVIWPLDAAPKWTEDSSVRGSILSSAVVQGDVPLEDGQWFSGNHWWFRSRVLTDDLKFKNIWLTEPDFQLNLIERGFSGMAGPDAVAGHRIQPALLEESVVVNRAKKGGEKARVRLQPYRKTVRQARLFHAHPVLARIFCILNQLRWRAEYFFNRLFLRGEQGFAKQLVALERMAIAREYLRVASTQSEYSVWKSSRSKARS